jgi:polyketide biosynthesis enoyl-CoA hydratase PksH
MHYETIKVRFEEPVCHLQIDRPQANNTIDARLIAECSDVLAQCEDSAITAVVLSGTPEVFCFGADFKSVASGAAPDPDAMYDLWLRLATGPYVTIAHVRGQANAGGVGFVAASDIVLASDTAQFSLSELLFGLYPACVLPFLIRRIGFQKAHYLTLSTAPVTAAQAQAWGLVDAVDANSDALMRRHLMRLRRLSKTAIRRYKSYMSRIATPLHELKAPAVTGNRDVFSDRENVAAIARYVERGVFPWEAAS